MRALGRLLVVTLLVVLAAVPVVAVATAVVTEPEDDVVAQQTTTPTPPPTTAPAVEIEPAETEADRAERNRKLFLGITSVVLLGIVIWGRSIRSKRKKKAEGK